MAFQLGSFPADLKTATPTWTSATPHPTAVAGLTCMRAPAQPQDTSWTPGWFWEGAEACSESRPVSLLELVMIFSLQ